MTRAAACVAGTVRTSAAGESNWSPRCPARTAHGVAERAPDGFRIVSWTSDTPDKVRRRPWNQARHDGDEKSVKRMHGVKYAVLKNPDKLTDRRSEASGNLRDTDPKGRPYRSWRLREPLRTPPKRPATRPGPN